MRVEDAVQDLPPIPHLQDWAPPTLALKPGPGPKARACGGGAARCCLLFRGSDLIQPRREGSPPGGKRGWDQRPRAAVLGPKLPGDISGPQASPPPTVLECVFDKLQLGGPGVTNGVGVRPRHSCEREGRRTLLPFCEAVTREGSVESGCQGLQLWAEASSGQAQVLTAGRAHAATSLPPTCPLKSPLGHTSLGVEPVCATVPASSLPDQPFSSGSHIPMPTQFCITPPACQPPSCPRDL